MTHSPSDQTPKPPAWKPLDSRQRRVLGVLIEKAKTTPAGYPMSVNAVVVGCNQKSNREPPMTLESDDVEQALSELITLGAASEVDWMGRVPKYRHHGYEWLGVSKVEIAVLTELLLRGEQTLGELRSRAARMEPIADLAALKPVVDALVQRGLMIELTAPGRGQIVGHALYPRHEMEELKTRYAGHAPRGSAFEDQPGGPGVTPSPSPGAAPAIAHPALGAGPGVEPERIDQLSSALAELREEVARLRERIDALERRVGSQG
jgi:uncharacterized protein